MAATVSIHEAGVVVEVSKSEAAGGNTIRRFP